jgi:hypothetical protein
MMRARTIRSSTEAPKRRWLSRHGDSAIGRIHNTLGVVQRVQHRHVVGFSALLGLWTVRGVMPEAISTCGPSIPRDLVARDGAALRSWRSAQGTSEVVDSTCHNAL